MRNTVDREKTDPVLALFRLAFRPFFLGGAIFSLVAILLWGCFWIIGLPWSPYGGWIWWHAHEMLFGFVVAIIAGFLLTAVQNWTGQESISSWPLVALFMLWLTPRLLLLIPQIVETSLLPWLDLAFLPVTAWVLGSLVWRARQIHNLVFVPFLLLLAVANAQMHWALINGNSLLAREASHSVIFLIVFVMVLMGGRVIPAFTANGTGTPKVEPNQIIELLSLSSAGLIALLHLFGMIGLLPDLLVAGLFFFAACVHLLRFLRWRPWVSLQVPLLWSLHSAYFFIVLGLFLCALRFAGLSLGWFGHIANQYTTILHGFTLGGMGLLILAMMSRVALGHTGRPLVISHWISLAFLCLGAACISRVWLPLLSTGVTHYLSYLLSIALWLLAYGLFVVIYLPVLCKARIDGRPG